MKAFLVDDEFLQRKLVKKSVDWQSIGIELCGEAEDGEEALEKIFMLKPDILIMDINIPYVNGIEVSKKVKKVFPETQVIILSAYGEFEYAKEALSFGALSFVLKPLNPKELTSELMKCKEKIQKYSRDFEGMLSDKECIQLIGIARGTYYKYKREKKDGIC